MPLSKKILSGYLTFKQNNNVIVYTELYPRSTKSPIMINLFYGIPPPLRKSYFTSKNWPWTSPAILTGDYIDIILDYYDKILRTIIQSFLTDD